MWKLFQATIISLACVLGLTAQTSDSQTWTSDFRLQPDELTSVGRNPYFILEPGYVLVLAAGNQRLTITVLNETRKIDNVETRIVEERETANGRPVEIPETTLPSASVRKTFTTLARMWTCTKRARLLVTKAPGWPE